MASPLTAIIGVSIVLGIFGLLVLTLVLTSFCADNERSRTESRETRQRVEQMRRRHQQEQRQWRQRRFRDVALLLIERGEALEGVPVAFQLPNQPEVSARRNLRRRRSNGIRLRESEMQLEDGADSGLGDAEALRISRLTLEELLADGRPRDADPGPDVMQMLLDGHEIRRHPTSEDDDSDHHLDGDEATTVNAARLLNQQDNGTGRNAPTAVNTGIGHAVTAPLNNQQPPVTREITVLHELHREKRRKYRKPAEEVYGEGAEYVQNPANDSFRQVDKGPESPTTPSRLWRLISPFTSFILNRSFADNKSAFEVVSRQESRVPQGNDVNTLRSPFETARGDRPSRGAPF
ncbi:hypothetical protein JKF63_03900 [Porcisia hertigi]|uniref:Uncharacterized protein n=1 Tax=Porcisia hertigi TaxID=2761500 RepID=A0A836IKZ8_9TRYP|nr:hypothetical protein JKF63_03900 [Porcisia hertigi]